MARFQKGNTAAKGIPKPNSGRDPDWLKEKCRDIIDRKELVDFLGNVAEGSVDGARICDRLKATEMLIDRGFGKAEQSVDMKLKDATDRPSKAELESALSALRDAIARDGMVEKK